MVYIETPHLLLRDWEEEDILPFVRMNSDKEVMEFFLTTLTEEETMAFYCRIRKEFEEYGYGLFALTVVAMVAAFILQFGSALKDNPVKALKSLLGVILLVVVMIVAWSMGSGEQMNIPGYSGTDNVPFWLKVTDMFLYTIYFLLGATVLAMLFSSIKKKLS